MPQEGLRLEQSLESVGPGLSAAGYLGTGYEELGWGADLVRRAGTAGFDWVCTGPMGPREMRAVLVPITSS